VTVEVAVRRYLPFAFVLILAALASPARPHAASGDVLPFHATERTLTNGLKVIVVPTGFPNLVSIDIPVQVGSRNEIEPGRSGFAHFFEHLMFRGTPSMPPERYRTIMSQAGSRDNASTGDDRTHFYATFAKEHLDEVIAAYADMFQHLAYSESDFKTEARAVLGEYNKNSADPVEKLFEVQRDHYYQLHTYKHTTMGFLADIENMPNEYAYSKVFFDRWYRPQYATIVVAGDVTPDDVLPRIEKYWGGWKPATTKTVQIPREPAPKEPRYAHMAWTSDTLAYVTVAFPGPPFDEDGKDSAAMQLIGSLYFGATSDLYTRLLVTEQKVDVLEVDAPMSVDPSLLTVLARVRKPADALYVRDQILATFAAARSTLVPAHVLADAKTHDRYTFARMLDSSERIASVVSRFAAYRRAYETVNARYRTIDALEPADLKSAATRYFIDAGLMVTTLSKDPLPSGIATSPALSSVHAATGLFATRSAPPLPQPGALTQTAGHPLPLVLQKSVLPQLNVKLLFTVGSAHDPVGKEGLAALTAAMIAKGGSRALTIDQIDTILYPIAGSFAGRADKEMTTFTGTIHRDAWSTFVDATLPQLLDPGFRQEDFSRVKAAQQNALVQDLRSNNEEELGKERLQTNIFSGTPYGHAALGTIAGINAITLSDVQGFARTMYTRENLMVGVSGDAPDEMVRALQARLASLPQGPAAPRVQVVGRVPSGIEVEILEKATRATAISLGFPIDVTRSHPDYPALNVARAWLGEHRIALGQLYQRMREIRGLNYGDYAYIEAFPRGMFGFFPDPNIARQRQIFEIWIRPVLPANGPMSLRIAIYELEKLVAHGLTKEQFETTRSYLMNNVYVMTARQDQQLGYALDSQWYGIGEFTVFMRRALASLTVDAVNSAITRHLNARNLSVVFITRDAAGLKRELLSDAPPPIKYDGAKPADLLAEDKLVGALRLNMSADRVTVTPIADVFAH
jgi:zinc protease